MFFRGFSSKKAVLDSKNGRTDPPRGGGGGDCSSMFVDEPKMFVHTMPRGAGSQHVSWRLMSAPTVRTHPFSCMDVLTGNTS